MLKLFCAPLWRLPRAVVGSGSRIQTNYIRRLTALRQINATRRVHLVIKAIDGQSSWPRDDLSGQSLELLSILFRIRVKLAVCNVNVDVGFQKCLTPKI